MTKDEWYYLIHLRNDASSKYGMATVVNQTGLVILPDSWKLPSGVTFEAGLGEFNRNEYTVTEWSKMESSGAIFLPAAGERYGTYVSGLHTNGRYWSSTGNDDNAYNLLFYNEDINGADAFWRSIGRSVRLIKR